MNVSINAKRLRASLPDVVERVRKGTRFTVIYRSRPAFQIVPVSETLPPGLSFQEWQLDQARALATALGK